MSPRTVTKESSVVSIRSSPFIPDTICLFYRADMHRTKAAVRVKDELVAYGKELDAKVVV